MTGDWIFTTLERIGRPHNQLFWLIFMAVTSGIWLLLLGSATTAVGVLYGVMFTCQSVLTTYALARSLYGEVRELHRKSLIPPKVETVIREIPAPPAASIHDAVPLPAAMGEYVYIAQDIDVTRYCKIGHTNSLQRRMSRFGVVLPFRIRCIHYIECADRRQVESYLHRKYRKQRVSGEWFKLSDADIDHLKSFRFQAGAEKSVPTENAEDQP